MPQFVMEGILEPDFQALDPFVQGYIQAMFFTSQSCIMMDEFHTPESQELIAEGQADGDLPNDAGFLDLHPSALAEIMRECAEFKAEAGDDLIEALDNGRINGYCEEYAGMDFWYTRNGHGVGFWDRDLGDLGDTLSDICKGYGEVNPWFSDPDPASPTGHGWVHHSM